MRFRRHGDYRDEDVKNQVEIEVKNGFKNYCFVPRNSHMEDKLADKLETGRMDEAAQEALNRLDRDPLAEEVVQQQEQQQEQQHEQEQEQQRQKDAEQ